MVPTMIMIKPSYEYAEIDHKSAAVWRKFKPTCGSSRRVGICLLMLSNHIRTSVPSDFVFAINDDSIHPRWILDPKLYTEHRELHVRGGAVSNIGILDTCIHPHYFFVRLVNVQLKYNYVHIWVAYVTFGHP